MSTLAPPCAADPNLWFSNAPDDIARAKAICSGCWRLRACEQDVQNLQPEFGVWAGKVQTAKTLACGGCGVATPVTALGYYRQGDGSRLRLCGDCHTPAPQRQVTAQREAALRTLQEARDRLVAQFADRLVLFSAMRDDGMGKFDAVRQLGLNERSAFRYESRYQAQRQQEVAA